MPTQNENNENDEYGLKVANKDNNDVENMDVEDVEMEDD